MSRDNKIMIYTFGTHAATELPPDLAGMTLVDLCELLPDLVDTPAGWPHPDDAQETALQLQWDPRLEELSRRLVKQAADKMYGDALAGGGLIKPADFAICCRDGRRLSPILAAHLQRDLWLYGGGFDAQVVNLQLKADSRAAQEFVTQLDRMGASIFEASITGPASTDLTHYLILGLEELADLLSRTTAAGRTVSWRLANFPTWITHRADTPHAMSVDCQQCSYRTTRSFDGSLPSVATALVDLTVRAEHRHLSTERTGS